MRPETGLAADPVVQTILLLFGRPVHERGLAYLPRGRDIAELPQVEALKQGLVSLAPEVALGGSAPDAADDMVPGAIATGCDIN